MYDTIYSIIVKHYGRLYGHDECERMTNHIINKINSGEFTTRMDIQMYVWMQTSGGGVAELTGWKIHEALPHLISDEDIETRHK